MIFLVFAADRLLTRYIAAGRPTSVPELYRVVVHFDVSLVMRGFHGLTSVTRTYPVSLTQLR